MASVRYRFQTLEFADTDIHIRTLRDRQQFDDRGGAAAAAGVPPAFWALFGVLWPSGELLARLMDDYDLDGKRVLEVGCGIGLASLLMNEKQVDITASDQHPGAGEFLQYNTSLNDCADIPFFHSSWNSDASEHGRFDLVVGSDLLYESWQVETLSGFINQHAAPDGAVIIVDPGRGNGRAFCKQMAAHGFSESKTNISRSEDMREPFTGHLLEFSRQG